MNLGKIKVLALVSLVVGFVAVTGYGYYTDQAFLKQKVGACPCAAYWTIPVDKVCFETYDTCGNYQRFVQVPGGTPVPAGCLPKPSWDQGCPGESYYQLGGSAEDGAMGKSVKCMNREKGNCLVGEYFRCVDGTGRTISCGDKDDVQQCPAP
jgi:hypothetical protein